MDVGRRVALLLWNVLPRLSCVAVSLVKFSHLCKIFSLIVHMTFNNSSTFFLLLYFHELLK